MDEHGVKEVRIAGDDVVAVCLCGKESGTYASETDARAELDEHIKEVSG